MFVSQKCQQPLNTSIIIVQALLSTPQVDHQVLKQQRIAPQPELYKIDIDPRILMPDA
jgi:hypothetical protein